MIDEAYFEVVEGIDDKGDSYYLIPFDFKNFEVDPRYYTSPLQDDPLLYGFDASYTVHIKEYSLNADYYLLSNLGSQDCIELLDRLDVKYRAIPLNVNLIRQKIPAKKYFLIYVSEVVSILDEALSSFEVMQDKYSGDVIFENGFKQYDEISKFVIDMDKVHGHDLFYCSEINKLVCSMAFKNAFIEQGLSGIDFRKIDGEYQYYAIDPALLKFL